ncbi:hypothetical protein PVAND_009661 [Polypedilum vanderplanki]|uniref:Uncharacterized protein n=1 Tax=Polypedilum vanderplanki TaxID=319348 RepID=A0A9J6CE88_POLVA|nr:hypothetical protein PVAND_009661 [Polypedilum vanderplanki]
MDTPLNKAHFYARRAMQMQNLEQKIEYIEKSIENFGLALSQSTNPKALESIQMQKEHNEKQLELLNYKMNFRNQKIASKQQQQKIDDDDYLPSNIRYDINERLANAITIQLDLYKNIETSDKMLEELKRYIPDNANFKMNEFQTLSSRFNELFEQLVACVDDTMRENEELKERLRTVEEKDTKLEIVETTSVTVTKIEDVSKEKDTQRDSDSSPEEMHELPPLELPPDFNLV